jgi:vancomycin resistance protein VanW
VKALRFVAAAILVLAVYAVVAGSESEQTLSSFATPLSGRMASQRQNATLALKKLDGAVIQPGEVFSFNARVGTWSKDQGYVKAPVSFSGTLIPASGGGVCQTSTTLYNAAVLAGLEVIERHPHAFAPNYVPPGRDAAVAYSSVDLKVRNPYTFPLTIHTRPTKQALIVEIVGKGEVQPTEFRQDVRQVRGASTFEFGTGPSGLVRNPGKTGYDVTTYAVSGESVTLLSRDSYPPMHRVVEYR